MTEGLEWLTDSTVIRLQDYQTHTAVDMPSLQAMEKTHALVIYINYEKLFISGVSKTKHPELQQATTCCPFPYQDEPVGSEIQAFCPLQHTSQGKTYLLEHEKGTSNGVILVDKTCFLMCDRCAILQQNESFHLFTASLNPLALVHIVRAMLVLQLIVTNGTSI